MSKLVIGLAAFVLLAAGGALAGGALTGSPSVGVTTTRTETGEDVSGPCDEAEHANDPRCTGAPVLGDDDRGEDRRGRHHRGHDDNGDDDRSGSNSGRG